MAMSVPELEAQLAEVQGELGDLDSNYGSGGSSYSDEGSDDGYVQPPRPRSRSRSRAASRAAPAAAAPRQRRPAQPQPPPEVSRQDAALKQAVHMIMSARVRAAFRAWAEYAENAGDGFQERIGRQRLLSQRAQAVAVSSAASAGAGRPPRGRGRSNAQVDSSSSSEDDGPASSRPPAASAAQRGKQRKQAERLRISASLAGGGDDGSSSEEDEGPSARCRSARGSVSSRGSSARAPASLKKPSAFTAEDDDDDDTTDDETVVTVRPPWWMDGTMWKQSPKNATKFLQRYFTLGAQNLEYAGKDGSKFLIDLDSVRSIRRGFDANGARGSMRPDCELQFEYGGGTLIRLRAASAREAAEWVRNLQSACNSNVGLPPHQPPPPPMDSYPGDHSPLESEYCTVFSPPPTESEYQTANCARSEVSPPPGVDDPPPGFGDGRKGGWNDSDSDDDGRDAVRKPQRRQTQRLQPEQFELADLDQALDLEPLPMPVPRQRQRTQSKYSAPRQRQDTFSNPLFDELPPPPPPAMHDDEGMMQPFEHEPPPPPPMEEDLSEFEREPERRERAPLRWQQAGQTASRATLFTNTGRTTHRESLIAPAALASDSAARTRSKSKARASNSPSKHSKSPAKHGKAKGRAGVSQPTIHVCGGGAVASSYLCTHGIDGYETLESCRKLKAASSKWRPSVPLDACRAGCVMARIGDTLFTFGGGAGCSSVERLNLSGKSRSWKTIPGVRFQSTRLLNSWLPTFSPAGLMWGEGVQAPAVAVVKDKAFLFGGSDNCGALSSVQVFERLRNQEQYDGGGSLWDFELSSGPPMPVARAGPAAAAISSAIYVCGGRDGILFTTWHDSLDRFDAKSGEWSSMASMDEPREGCALVALDGKLYAIGGVNAAGVMDSVECYNPKKDRWSEVRPMRCARQGCSAVVLDGSIVVMGGWDGSAVLKSTETLDMDTMKWSKSCALRTPRMYAGAVAVAPGDSKRKAPKKTRHTHARELD